MTNSCPLLKTWLNLACSAALFTAPAAPAADPKPDKTEETDAAHRRLIVGVWEDHYQGKRTMTVRPDGTATMVVELSGIKATLYASRLTFEMKWSIRQGRLSKQTTSGQPPARVNLILKMMGDRVEEQILELNQTRLRLLDPNGKTQYDWRRVPQPDKKSTTHRPAPPSGTLASR